MERTTRYLTNCAKAFKEVFREKKYWLITTLAVIIIFSLNAVVRNYKLLISQFSLKLLWALILATKVSMTVSQLLFLVITSILASILFSLSVFLVQRQIRQMKASVPVSASGIIAAILVPACPSCALGLLGVLGLSGFFAVLPLKGAELGILGIGIVLFALVYVSSKIVATVCPLPQQSRKNKNK